uniref:C-type lectin domain-containing protein n=1 Tax=Acrobeloides nanus TaxID=290746 RepID=A0A914DYU1_9BILA
MPRRHGTHHFEQEASEAINKPNESNQFIRFKTYFIRKEVNPLRVLIAGILLGIIITLCLSGIVAFFHYTPTEKTIESLTKEKDYAINVTDLMDGRVETLSNNLYNASQELQSLYDALKNHTFPNSDVDSFDEYLSHIRHVDTSCGAGGKYFSLTKSCYYMVHRATSWHEASNDCINRDAHLVSIHSSEENQFLIELSQLGRPVSSWSDFVWIGLARRTVVYQWSDGTPVDYDNWDPTALKFLDCVYLMADQLNLAYTTVKKPHCPMLISVMGIWLLRRWAKYLVVGA